MPANKVATAPAPRAGWPGVGPQLAGRLAKLDIRGPQDLVLHLPLRYEDETVCVGIAELRGGAPLQVEGVVTDCEVRIRGRRQLVAQVQDATGSLTVRLLHFYPQQQKQLTVGQRVRLFGEARTGIFGAEMIHPRIRTVGEGEALPTALTPIYPTTAGLAQSALRKLIGRALDSHRLEELLPEAVRRMLRLMPLPEAVRLLHLPPPEADAAALVEHRHPAWQRIKFEELLVQQLSLRKAHAARRARTAPPLRGDDGLRSALLAGLPFALTGAQQRADTQICADLAEAHPMQRLLQGDVGSGKTIVAALAMLRAVEAGWQAALMAPTEILAEQHYLKLSAWLAPLGVAVEWIAGSLTKKQREAAIARLMSGESMLAVGTHALIEDPVALPRLGLAVVDEQHRFGVRQRLALREKGGAASPHMLMMSATPIPRTLAMSYYADLDVSVLDELPPGRTPILTKLVSDARRDEVLGRVRDACAEGRQAYWVCPLVEESEALDLQTAIDTHARLSEQLPELKVGLVHGRLKAEEKRATMAAFAASELHLLVATTVIEVGVDVPNASLMIIEHAERFGLAQLHQLRGRVGRGTAESVCILLFGNALSETARARLKVIYEHTDGFMIAREDLRIRGPGEFVGARQSGVPLLRYADLENDGDLVEQARDLAEALLREQAPLAEAIMQRWVAGRESLLRA
ncbi:ATP-dependent DNA helicase RecG [Denitromonas iodatirespirans]|uniref:ATP-dependent DNA helicase RecG n=1 Tax=Denitromonas iodatirespirans TaxID=2795389 RepID=A0A944HCJ2_DENI1|nr:ATP-dependent DNA helicase RecG [Denitromonas iodatirespirans]MBT0962782.1 ATP-dependent DNA helicase RecG [Denitromonas iodatirespirans]